jgi:phage protein D
MITGMDIQAGAKIAPAFMLKLDNDDITQDFSDRLISLTMTDNRGFEADQLDIELDDTDGQIAMPPRGNVDAVVRLAGFRADKKGRSRSMKSSTGARLIR